MVQSLIKKEYLINSLRKRAERFMSMTTDSNEIFKEDITKLLVEEIRFQVRNGEIVIIEVKGKPRTGKSTVAIYLSKDIIDDELKKSGKKEKSIKFGMRNIARDEQEYSEKMSNPKLMNDVILTDEQNELEKGGENATTEQQLKSVFSDVMAGRYVHRVNVSPQEVIDNNSDIWVETIGIDSKKMTTHCRVYYKISNAQIRELWQPIGYINISVKDIIYNWEKHVKHIFLKTNKTKKDVTFINNWAKKDFYVLYMIKKYQKMELITKYNILRPRDLPFAKVIIDAVEELKDSTRHMHVTVEMIKNYVEKGIRENKLRASIIGKRLVTDRARGVLDIYESLYKIENKLAIEKSKGKKMNKDKVEILENIIKSNKRLINAQMDEFKLYIRVWNEYLKGIK